MSFLELVGMSIQSLSGSPWCGPQDRAETVPLGEPAAASLPCPLCECPSAAPLCKWSSVPASRVGHLPKFTLTRVGGSREPSSFQGVHGPQELSSSPPPASSHRNGLLPLALWTALALHLGGRWWWCSSCWSFAALGASPSSLHCRPLPRPCRLAARSTHPSFHPALSL